MKIVRSVLDGLAASRVRGIVLAVLFLLGTGLAVYVSRSPDTGSMTVVADAVAIPSPVRVDPLSSVPMPVDKGAGPAVGPTGSSDRLSLMRALQTGLRRAGCYDGPIDGLWTPKAKDSMRRFVAAVNAKLPVDHPDPVLLALVESNRAAICTPGSSPAPTDVQAPARVRTEATASPPTPVLVDAPAIKANSQTIERVWVPAEMIVPPARVEARAAPAAASAGPDGDPDRPVKVAPPSSQTSKAAPRRVAAQKQKPTP